MRRGRGRERRSPETVLAMVQARLEALDAEARRVLRAGERLRPGVLARRAAARCSAASAARRSSTAWLAELVERELDRAAARGEVPGRGRSTRSATRSCARRRTRCSPTRIARSATGSPASGSSAAGERDAIGPRRALRARRRARARGRLVTARGGAGARGNDFARGDRSAPSAASRAARRARCSAALRLVQAEAHKWRGESRPPRRARRRRSRCSSRVGRMVPRAHRGADWRQQAGRRRLRRGVGRAGRGDGARRGGAERGGALPLLVRGGAHARQPARDRRRRCSSRACASRVSSGRRRRGARGAAPDVAFRAALAGDHAAAVDALEVAVGAFGRAGDRRQACSVQLNMGFILTELGALSAPSSCCAAVAQATRMDLARGARDRAAEPGARPPPGGPD